MFTHGLYPFSWNQKSFSFYSREEVPFFPIEMLLLILRMMVLKIISGGEKEYKPDLTEILVLILRFDVNLDHISCRFKRITLTIAF